MTHDELLNDLASHLAAPARMVWRDMQLGPNGSRRPDVFTLMKSYSRPDPTIYEVKVTRSDYLSDVRTGKWTAYRQFAGIIMFAAPAGLLRKDEIPFTAGLIQRHAKSWRWAKRPVPHDCEIPKDAWMKLLIDGVRREGPAARLRSYQDDWWHRDAKKRWGEAAAKWISDAAAVKEMVEDAEERAKVIIQIAEQHAVRIREKALRGLVAGAGVEPALSRL